MSVFDAFVSRARQQPHPPHGPDRGWLVARTLISARPSLLCSHWPEQIALVPRERSGRAKRCVKVPREFSIRTQ